VQAAKKIGNKKKGGGIRGNCGKKKFGPTMQRNLMLERGRGEKKDLLHLGGGSQKGRRKLVKTTKTMTN